MKIFKGLPFFFLIVCLGSCFNPPEFPIVPEIEFSRIEFVDSDIDSLILYITFRDGDGDLGLNNEDFYYISYPYNNTFFFQENGKVNPDNGKLMMDTIPTYTQPTATSQYDILDIPNPKQGKLVFPRTRKKAGYDYLPTFDCIHYEYIVDRKLLIAAEDAAVLDRKQTKVDSLVDANKRAIYYLLKDTFLIAVNPNHYNIEVDFLVKDPGNPKADPQGFVEFDWRSLCTQSFDGRFPVLSEKTGSGLDGTLKYTMNSVGFGALFSVKTLKLRVQIKDRALHKSKWIETPEFTLDKIRVR